MSVQVPTSKQFPYWVAAMAFSAAAACGLGWIQAERQCAERESDLLKQVRQAYADCEAEKRAARMALDSFILLQSQRYADLIRETSKKKR